METRKIQIRTLLICVVMVFCIEVGMWLALSSYQWNSMMVLGLARLFETTLILLTVVCHGNGLSSIGLASSQMILGIRKGLTWSAGFGVLVFSAFLALFLFGIDPLALIQSPLPANPLDILLFFLVGSLVAPVAEEVFFRGVLYGFFRRWGMGSALVLSTLFFVLPHLGSQGLPVTQMIGGVLFAVAYEKERSLMVPVVIHALGNMAIFSFSFVS